MFLVYGLQKSGIAIVKLLKKQKVNFKIWDDDHRLRELISRKFNKHLFIDPRKNDLRIFTNIYVSPGISLRQQIFKKLNKLSNLNRDLNIYISNLKNEKVIAITGTNGKSTTTKLIGDLLRSNKLETFVGGNIGKPLCNAYLSNKNYKYHVVELSSFQLETIKNINTNISIITNLASDHLDRYKNINDYVSQKKKIITKTGINLISLDDKYSRKIFTQKNIKNKISFSLHNKKANIYFGDDFILDNYFKKNKKIFIKQISKDFEGNFNKQNIVITYICNKLLKLPLKNFHYTIRKFKGLSYRSKVIFENKCLKIINNSKATNISSTINSIMNYENIYLILGGIAKEKNFEILSNHKDKIICVYLFGRSSSMIEKKIKKFLKVKTFENLELAVQEILIDVKKIKLYSNILFAPACTSFDQYKNFEERGNHFSEIISKYKKKL